MELSQERSTPQWLISTHGEEQSGGTPKTSSEKWSLKLASPRAATGDCQPQHQPVTPSEIKITQDISPGHLTNRGHSLGEWDTLQDAREEHLGSVTNWWGVLWRKQKLREGEIKVVCEGGSVDIREKGGKRGWCKLFLAHILFQLCPLPGHSCLSCLSNTHTAPEGLPLWQPLRGDHWPRSEALLGAYDEKQDLLFLWGKGYLSSNTVKIQFK